MQNSIGICDLQTIWTSTAPVQKNGLLTGQKTDVDLYLDVRLLLIRSSDCGPGLQMAFLDSLFGRDLLDAF